MPLIPFPFGSYTCGLWLRKLKSRLCVDMNQVEFSYEMVALAGTFNDWSTTAHPMEDPEDDGVFCATVVMPAGPNEYKFVVNGGEVWETLNNAVDPCTVNDPPFTNRFVEVEAGVPQNMGVVCWSSCFPCLPPVDISLCVDMNTSGLPYTIVAVAGTFNGWDPSANPMEDADGDGVFCTVVPMIPGSNEYKFVANNGAYWEILDNAVDPCAVNDPPYSNRFVEVLPDTPMDLGTVCWSSCGACPDIENTGGPTISDPCTCAGNGLFDEEVVVISQPNESWTVLMNTGYLDPVTGIDFPVGFPLTENPAGSGIYTLLGQHLDDQGYEITVQGGPIGSSPVYFLSIDNLCWYPDPSIDNLPMEICLSDDPITLEGSAQLGDGSGPATAESEVWTGPGVSGNLFDPAGLTPGPHTIDYTFNALDNDPNENHPGCESTVSAEINILEGPDLPVVSDISVCPGEDTTIEPEQTGGGTIVSCGTNSPVVITGVGQGTLLDGYPRFIEMFTYETIDFSNWELQTYINGSATVTHSTDLSSLGTVPAGKFIYVLRFGGGGANEQAFLDWFELNQAEYDALNTVTGAAPNVNGDDALSLFNGTDIVDVFGVIGLDGTGTSWDYTDGWAYRMDDTEPDGNFNESDWTILTGSMVGGGTNSTAQVPFPIATYECTATSGELVFNFYGDAGLTNLLNPNPVPSYDPGPLSEGTVLTIWVSSIDSDGCESEAVAVTITVFTTPDPPLVENINVCPRGNTTIVPELQGGSPNGNSLFNFYADNNLNALLAGPVPEYDPGTTQATSPQTFWVTVVDENGCESAAVQVIVTVEDVTPPDVICLADRVIYLDPGDCSIFLSWNPPTATDNCSDESDISIVQTGGPLPGSEFELNDSPYLIEYTVTDEFNNSTICTFIITIEGYPDPTSTMACNDEVQASLDQNCTLNLNGDMFLEGGPYPCYNVFEIYIDGYEDQGNVSNIPIYLSTGTYMVNVVDAASNNSCMTTLVVEDKIGPELINCEPFFINPSEDYPVNEDGYVHPDVSGYPVVNDNCDNWELSYSDEYEFLGCEAEYYEVIHRKWHVSDRNNGLFDECTQEIFIEHAVLDDIDFPLNYDGLTSIGNLPMLDCSSGFETDPLGNPSPAVTGNPGIISYYTQTSVLFLDDFEAYPQDLDLNNVNGWTGIGAGGAFKAVVESGNGALGSDGFGVLEEPGWGAAVQKFDVEAGNSYEYSIWIKRFTDDNMKLQIRVGTQNLFEVSASPTTDWQKLTVEYVPPTDQEIILRMIKNDGVMAVDQAKLTTTSSNPDFEIKLPGNFEVFYSDMRFDLFCGTKILRDWVVVDDCTGELLNHTQIIRISDDTAPTFMVPEDMTLNTKGYACDADIEVPWIMHLEDNCDPYPRWYVSIDNAYLTGDENGNGFVDDDEIWYIREAKEGLHTLCYYAVDNCGNEYSECIEVEVVDNVPPIPVCEQYKQVSVSPDGIAVAYAEDFDSGSFDNCGPVWFKVLRGSEYNDSNVLKADKGCEELNGDDRPETPRYFDEETGKWVNNELWFDDEVYFCCEDIGREVMVTLRVFEVDPEPYTVDGAVKAYHVNNPEGKLYGKYNDCLVTVKVECKLPPQIIADKNLYVSCEENLDPYQNTALLPDVISICGYDLSYEDSDKIGDVCGGRIERTWTAVGCEKSVSFVQYLYLNAAEPFDPCTISFPADETDIICPESTGEPGYPTWDENPCNIVTAEIVNIDTFTFVDDACYKIVVDWAVIDWCVYEPNSGAEDNVDVVNGRKLVCNELVEDGYYRYTQILMVTDVYAPEIQVEDECEALTEGCYAEDVVIEASATDTCNVDQKFWWKYIVTNMDTWETVQYSYNFSPVPDQGVKGSRSKDNLDGTANASLQILNPLGVGNYQVTWSVGDGCGNANSAIQYFTVVDKKPPTPFMLDVSTAYMSNCMVEVCAKMFDKGACDGDCLASYDNCSEELYFTYTDVLPIILHPEWLDANGLYYFNPETGVQYNASAGRAKYLSGEAHSWDPEENTSCRVYNYSDLPDGELPPPYEVVQIYVWDQFALNEDCDDGNYDWAEIELYINNDGDCGPEDGALILSGTIRQAETGEEVDDVVVMLDNASPEYPKYVLSEVGGYAFMGLTSGGYELSGEKNDDWGNGVSTLDLVLIQKHLLGIKALDNSYDLIASDANLSGSISAADLFEFRKLILGVEDELSGGKSWRFVEGSYSFANPMSPWNELGYAEVLAIDLEENVDDANLIGIKLGDINGSAVANARATNLETRSGESRYLVVKDAELEEGEVEVAIEAKSFTEVSGMQFTLELEGMSYEGIESGALQVTNNNVGTPRENTVTFSWNTTSGQSVVDGEVLFTLKLRNDRAGLLSQRMGMSSALTQSEIYEGEELAIYDLGLEVRGSEEFSFALYQNEPNPFSAQTSIGFTLPEAGAYELSILDVTGKVVKVIENEGERGYNVVTMRSEELPAGLLYYQLESGEYNATKKMILIK
jgi:hypothetical protein